MSRQERAISLEIAGIRLRSWALSAIRLFAVAITVLGASKLFAPYLATEIPALAETIIGLGPTPEWYFLLFPGLVLMKLTGP
jgi:hypothetical protein